MAFFSTKDEITIGGYTAGNADLRDVVGDLRKPIGELAADKTAYGFLPKNILEDVDIFDLGTLSPGEYSIDVDEYDCDY